jgi:hypothetical protein
MELLEGVERLYVFNFSLAYNGQCICYRKPAAIQLQLQAVEHQWQALCTEIQVILYQMRQFPYLSLDFDSTQNHCVQSLLKVNVI